MMSTIASTVFEDSDSDPDYVPYEEPEEEVEVKDVAVEVTNDEERRTKDKETRAVLWADFQSSVKESQTKSASHKPAPPKMVKVVKRYLFAGEESTQAVEVPEDSDDAKKWPLWDPSEGFGVKDCHSGAPDKPKRQSPPLVSSLDRNQFTSMAGPSSRSQVEPPKPLAAPGKRPGPRKSKTLLSAPSGKTKKLSTLEKSSMDWKAHVEAETAAGAQLGDELEANRRGGGYLERVEFMERVGTRREELFEQGRAAKRRKT